MKRVPASELRHMDDVGLVKKAQELLDAIGKVKITLALRKEKDTAKHANLRRERARTLTVLREKELESKKS